MQRCSGGVRKVIEAIFWNPTEASLVASSWQMQREPLMAILLEACKDWLARGYCIGHVFGRLYLNCLEACADIVPKASSMRPHQDTAQYAKRLGVRFSSKDSQPTSIIFSTGRGVHSDKVSVPLRSSCYYVADEAIMKTGYPLDIFHSVPPPEPGCAWLCFFVDLYPVIEGSDLQLCSSVKFVEDLAKKDKTYVPATCNTSSILWHGAPLQVKCVQKDCTSGMALRIQSGFYAIGKSQT